MYHFYNLLPLPGLQGKGTSVEGFECPNHPRRYIVWGLGGDLVRSSTAEAGYQDVECRLFGWEGASTGMWSWEIPTGHSQNCLSALHCTALHWHWNPSPRKGLNSFSLWSCPRRGAELGWAYLLPSQLTLGLIPVNKRVDSLCYVCRDGSWLLFVLMHQMAEQIVFINFMNRISRCIQGDEGIRFGCLRIRSLLFGDDLVLLASSDHDLQLLLEWFAAECEVAGIRIITSKSKTKRHSTLFWVRDQVLPQVEEFNNLGSSSGMREKWSERLIGRLVWAVIQALYQYVVKTELSWKVKISIYQSIYVLPSSMVLISG